MAGVPGLVGDTGEQGREQKYNLLLPLPALLLLSSPDLGMRGPRAALTPLQLGRVESGYVGS